jgi:excisionase family DNA binding protein
MPSSTPVAPPPPSSLLSIRDAARILGVSPRHLYGLAANGTLPTARLGSRVLIARDIVDGIVRAAAQGRAWTGRAA